MALFISSLLALSIYQPAIAIGPIKTLLLTGAPAADGPEGAVFQEFGLANINDHSGVAFVGAMQPGLGGVTIDTAVGLWTYSQGASTGVAVGDPPAPGVADAYFETVATAPQFSNSGELFADYRLELGPGGVTANDDDGGWLFANGAAELIYREGDSLPGFPDDAELFFGTARINADGNLAVRASFRAGLGGITASNGRGLWIRSNGAMNLIARSGASVAGAPAGAVLSDFGISSFSENEIVATTGALQEGIGGVTSANSAAVFSNRGGEFALVYREGETATGETVFDSFSGVQVNSSNRLAINATLKTGVGGVGPFTDRGIWIEQGGVLQELVRSNTPMPGVSGRRFGSFSNLLFNDADHVAFTANSSSSSIGFETIFSNASGALALVARDFGAAPGTTSGVTFDFDHIDFIGIPRLQMNDAGQVAFFAGLRGTGVTTANNLGIWAQDTAGQLQLILRKGEPIEVAPGDLRTVESFNFGNINNRGQIVFNAKFTDGTFGLFVSNQVAQVPGDYNADGKVDAADYTVWRDGLGSAYTMDDYQVWKSHFGQHAGSGALHSAERVPEAGMLALAVLAFAGSGSVFVRRERRSR